MRKNFSDILAAFRRNRCAKKGHNLYTSEIIDAFTCERYPHNTDDMVARLYVRKCECGCFFTELGMEFRDSVEARQKRLFNI